MLLFLWKDGLGLAIASLKIAINLKLEIDIEITGFGSQLIDEILIILVFCYRQAMLETLLNGIAMGLS